jgi:hypothetical protein
MRGDECWRNGRHSYITGKWECYARSCEENTYGKCSFFKPKREAV